MSEKLYIIGNGFDLHHGMPTSYTDFGQHLKIADPNTYGFVCEYLAGGAIVDQFWYEFEDALGRLDRHTLEQAATDFLVPYGGENWSDAYHHSYQFEIDQVASALSETLLEHFAEWLTTIQVPKTKILALDPTAQYLSFNYTRVLENLYRIPDHQILHLHGAVGDPIDKIILGHARELENDDPYRGFSSPEEADTRIAEGVQILDSYFKKTAKPTAHIIAHSTAFWSSLSSVKRVSVLGHSLESVDQPYFTHINGIIGLNDPEWAFSYYNDQDAVWKMVERLNLRANRTSVCCIGTAAQL